MSSKKKASKKVDRKPPVKIPLEFDSAVGGLLAVDSAKVKAAAKKKKKPAKKKRTS